MPSMPMEEDAWRTSLAWWNKRRLAYNIVLVVAGIIAFGLYVAAFELWAPKDDPDSEITAVTTLFQGVAYLFCIALANVLYCRGPAVELFVPPEWLRHYRRSTLAGGFVLSALLPLAAPALIALDYGLGAHPRSTSIASG